MTDVEELMRLIATHLDVPVSEIAPNARFIEDLRVGEMDVAALYMALEERFSVRIPAEDIGRLTTLSALARYLDAKLHSD